MPLIPGKGSRSPPRRVTSIRARDCLIRRYPSRGGGNHAKSIVLKRPDLYYDAGRNLLNRADIKVFTAATTDDILKIHIEETLNLIVTMLDLPGTRSESIFDIIWQSQKLKKVLVIMICEDSVSNRMRCKRCGAKYVLTMPVDPGQLQEKVRQFLKVPQRQAFRVILSVSVDGKFNDRPFLCFTENISATGQSVGSLNQAQWPMKEKRPLRKSREENL